MLRRLEVDPVRTAREAFLQNRRGELDRIKPIHRHFDDGADVSRWKAALREGSVPSHVLDQLLADGWRSWHRIAIVRSTYSTSTLANNSYSSLSLGLDRNETVTVTVDGWAPGSDERQRNEITLVRNEFSLFHGYFTHDETTVVRLAFSVPPLKAQLLFKTAC